MVRVLKEWYLLWYLGSLKALLGNSVSLCSLES